MSISAPQLPRELFPTGMSVAVIARPIAAGVLAHRSSAETRTVESNALRSRQETYFIAACAADQPDDADEAYLVTLHWAAYKGAAACTEPARFPEAVSAR